jgi:hypothetical protein
MKYLNKYVRFFETSVATKTKSVNKPVDKLPMSGSDEVVERLSKIYKNLDDTEKRDIDSYFE